MTRSVRIGSLVTAVTLALVVGACASARNTARAGAVTFSHLAHDVKVTEDQVYAAKIPGYDRAAHMKVQQGIRKVLVVASAYDSAVHDWPADAKATDAVIASQKALNAALDELTQVLPGAAAVREPLNRAIAALRAALGAQLVEARLGPVQTAGLVGGDAVGFLMLLQLGIGLFTAGKMTFSDLSGFLKAKGATDEELEAAKALVDADIAAIDAEAATIGQGTDPSPAG
jgi:hypothetical protein